MTSLRPPDALDQQGGDPAAAGRRAATGGSDALGEHGARHRPTAGHPDPGRRYERRVTLGKLPRPAALR
jgi:hypothetical protein